MLIASTKDDRLRRGALLLLRLNQVQEALHLLRDRLRPGRVLLLPHRQSFLHRLSGGHTLRAHTAHNGFDPRPVRLQPRLRRRRAILQRRLALSALLQLRRPLVELRGLPPQPLHRLPRTHRLVRSARDGRGLISRIALGKLCRGRLCVRRLVGLRLGVSPHGVRLALSKAPRALALRVGAQDTLRPPNPGGHGGRAHRGGLPPYRLDPEPHLPQGHADTALSQGAAEQETLDLGFLGDLHTRVEPEANHAAILEGHFGTALLGKHLVAAEEGMAHLGHREPLHPVACAHLSRESSDLGNLGGELGYLRRNGLLLFLFLRIGRSTKKDKTCHEKGNQSYAPRTSRRPHEHPPVPRENITIPLPLLSILYNETINIKTSYKLPAPDMSAGS